MWVLDVLNKLYGFKTKEQRQQSVIDWQADELSLLREELRLLKERESALILLPKLKRGTRYDKVVFPKEFIGENVDKAQILSEYLIVLTACMSKDCEVTYE